MQAQEAKELQMQNWSLGEGYEGAIAIHADVWI